MRACVEPKRRASASDEIGNVHRTGGGVGFGVGGVGFGGVGFGGVGFGGVGFVGVGIGGFGTSGARELDLEPEPRVVLLLVEGRVDAQVPLFRRKA